MRRGGRLTAGTTIFAKEPLIKMEERGWFCLDPREFGVGWIEQEDMFPSDRKKRGLGGRRSFGSRATSRPIAMYSGVAVPGAGVTPFLGRCSFHLEARRPHRRTPAESPVWSCAPDSRGQPGRCPRPYKPRSTEAPRISVPAPANTPKALQRNFQTVPARCDARGTAA